ncbi:TetR/AcrR family transcriptional regulator [Frankia sp. AgB1.9]|uniref:TetR/AcrR family transcriptional regulator n=1 Tax=unclassified Frankia TaxID=2632575 RepID=UPI001931BC03|nr:MULTISPECIES: TetR/AcrR family transcriptional regulator [unclassified Frankia]MBL7492884.1 TetR/AcrR family transcriptional regulator [Frankia sp. AgW1.1]MBL7551233.1 TetR/AcrR family transcriptional regulator [Frankia sp. AgB1.9]MBL7622769.1 TetR/AcrR family transcriptional regulator [Frankia sp. AgB1.8]
MDGRNARGARNREAIVDATLALVAERGALPTAHEIAQRAGLAPRSVFHHFPSLEALLAEAARSRADLWRSLLTPPEPGRSLAGRLAAALGQRAELFEQISEVRRVAVRLESSSPLLAELLDDSRGVLRRHLRRALNPELSAVGQAAAAGIEAAASWEMWDLLRRDLPVDAARAAMTALIEPLLTRASGTAPSSTAPSNAPPSSFLPDAALPSSTQPPSTQPDAAPPSSTEPSSTPSSPAPCRPGHA